MKIRLMGSADLVRAWSLELEKSYGITSAEYPCRGSTEIRAYFDLDDRQAAVIVGLPPAEHATPSTSAPANPAPRRRLKR